MSIQEHANARLQVLLVQDDAGQVWRVQEKLRELEIVRVELSQARDVDEALAWISRGELDLVLLDLHLPGAGLKALGTLQAAAPTVPIIALVRAEQEALGLEAVKAGAQDYLVVEELDRRLLGSTVRHALERMQAVRHGEERASLALMGSGDGLWDWNLKTGRIYLNACFKTLLGDASLPSQLDAWFSRVHPEDLPVLRAAIDAHLAGDGAKLEVEHRVRQRDGSWRWLLCRGLALRDPKHHAHRLVGSCTDIHARKQEQQALLREATHDALTGLPNRTALVRRLQQAMARSAVDGRCRFAVLFLDLDRFKVINDSLGHLVGDQLLVEVARRLTHVVRSQDMVTRFGGDEFVVLLEDVGSERTAAVTASRLQRAVSAPVELGGQRVFTTASIGVAISGRGYLRAEDYLRDADAAMYRAKASGRGRLQVFDPAMRADALMRFQVENDVWRALERGEFRLSYLPTVSLRTGAVCGFEALLRWDHPDRGTLLPGAFLPGVEESGLMPQVGEFVLRAACRQLAQWPALHRRADVQMTINLAASQLQDPQLPELVDDVLRSSGLEGSRLVVDITETMALPPGGPARETLHHLRARGMRVCVDDFGRGYSSLGQLQDFPLDFIKLDPLLVHQTGAGPQTNQLVRAVVELAGALGVGVVAEGVEREEQLEELLNLEVDAAQGSLFSAPVDAGAAALLLQGDGWSGAWRCGARARLKALHGVPPLGGWSG